MISRSVISFQVSFDAFNAIPLLWDPLKRNSEISILKHFMVFIPSIAFIQYSLQNKNAITMAGRTKLIIIAIFNQNKCKTNHSRMLNYFLIHFATQLLQNIEFFLLHLPIPAITHYTNCSNLLVTTELNVLIIIIFNSLDVIDYIVNSRLLLELY